MLVFDILSSQLSQADEAQELEEEKPDKSSKFRLQRRRNTASRRGGYAYVNRDCCLNPPGATCHGFELFQTRPSRSIGFCFVGSLLPFVHQNASA